MACLLFICELSTQVLDVELQHLKHLRLQARHLCHIRRLGNSEQGASPSQRMPFRRAILLGGALFSFVILQPTVEENLLEALNGLKYVGKG